MIDTAALVSLATSVPPHQFHQAEILKTARSVMAERYPEFESLSSLFANTGIRHRYGVKPMEWYTERRGWPERTQAFLEGAEILFMDVARKAMARADLSAADIDTVVTVCSTGIATPTLEARVAGKLGFRADVSRVPVFGLGCAGGVSGLSIASRLAQARPGTNVLLVALELCTLAVRHDELTKANIVAASLFGDGAAAVILRAGDGGATRIEACRRTSLARYARYHGMERRSRRLRRHLPAHDSRLRRRTSGTRRSPRCFRRMELSMDDIGRFICHPGGTKVIIALEHALCARSGHARPRARGHRRLRQHVGADRAVRAGTRAGARPAAAVVADGARARLHRKLRRAAARRVSFASIILALVTLQRLGELVSRAPTPASCWREARSRLAPTIIR